MRPLGARRAWAALLVAIIIVGALWFADHAQQSSAEQHRVAEQQQLGALMTATTIADSTRQAVARATRQADATAELAEVQAQATDAATTLTTYRASLDATVAADQSRARAANTALTRR